MVSGDLDKDTNNCFLLKNLLSSATACQGAVVKSGLNGMPWREPEEKKDLLDNPQNAQYWMINWKSSFFVGAAFSFPEQHEKEGEVSAAKT